MARRLFITLSTVGFAAGWLQWFSAVPVPLPARKVENLFSVKNSKNQDDDMVPSRSSYDFGLGKNKPVRGPIASPANEGDNLNVDQNELIAKNAVECGDDEVDNAAKNWVVHESVHEREWPSSSASSSSPVKKATVVKNGNRGIIEESQPIKTRRMVA